RRGRQFINRGTCGHCGHRTASMGRRAVTCWHSDCLNGKWLDVDQLIAYTEAWNAHPMWTAPKPEPKPERKHDENEEYWLAEFARMCEGDEHDPGLLPEFEELENDHPLVPRLQVPLLGPHSHSLFPMPKLICQHKHECWSYWRKDRIAPNR